MGHKTPYCGWGSFDSNLTEKRNALLSGTERLAADPGKVEGIEWSWERKIPRIDGSKPCPHIKDGGLLLM
jgi:hypothetical protein